MKDYFVREVGLRCELVLIGDASIQLQRGCRRRNVFIPGGVLDSYVIMYIVLKCSFKDILKWKGHFPPVFFIGDSPNFVLPMAFAMSSNFCKDSNCVLNGERLNFQGTRTDSTLYFLEAV